jgi:hypothetical protein
MAQERMMPPQEESFHLHEERLAKEEEIAKEVIAAREAGKTKAGGTRPVPGTGVRLGETAKGPRPHNKPSRMIRRRPITEADFLP